MTSWGSELWEMEFGGSEAAGNVCVCVCHVGIYFPDIFINNNKIILLLLLKFTAIYFEFEINIIKIYFKKFTKL